MDVNGEQANILKETVTTYLKILL